MLERIKDSLLGADDIGFEIRERPDWLRIGLPCSPLSLIFEQTPGGDVFTALHCSASRIFDGDRTDLHDVYSLLAASVFRHTGAFSAMLVDIEHPATMIPGELSGRYLVPEQGAGYLLPPDDVGLDSAKEVFGHLALFERLAHRVITFWHPQHSSPMGDGYDPTRQTDQIWARGVAEQLRTEASEEDLFFQRDSTDWLYYRTYDGSVAVVESAEVAHFLKAVRVDPSEEIAGINGFLYAGDHFHHYVSRELLHVADRVLGLEGVLLESASPAASVTIVPLEDSVVLSSGNRAVLLRHESGLSGFSRERSLVLERNRIEQERLFPPSEFTWSEEIDGGRFERLIYDLLECEPGVREVRAIGASRERDGGRDIVASWITPPTTGAAVMEGEAVARERRVIIQCKARKRSVGRSDLGGGILDTLFMYKAEGYFLATSSQPAVATIDLLDEIAQRGDYFTGWWGRTEIEQRLRRNPQVLRRYADIVQPVP
ncbi:restriction endonuclease [Streptomyces sp. NPDC006339]|uniref:restriction endonuclease n=1 Tax=Streptomyces sp. NPDC006339 TaxID=3156755 RepID=UPI0033B2A429